MAQCAPGGPCELPTGLPWYFGLAVALVWLTVVVGVLLLARRFLVRRLHDRRARRDGPDQLALGPSTDGRDLEPW